MASRLLNRFTALLAVAVAAQPLLASAQLYKFRKPSPGLVVTGAPSGGSADPPPATGGPAVQLSSFSLSFGA